MIYTIIYLTLAFTTTVYDVNTDVLISRHNVCLRDSATSTSFIVGKPFRGDSVTIINHTNGLYKEGILSGIWYQVITKRGDVGWVFEQEVMKPTSSEEQLVNTLDSLVGENSIGTIWQLGILKSVKGKNSLIKLLQPQKENYLWIIEALGTYRDTSLLPLFIDIYNKPGDAGKKESIVALANYKRKEYCKYIIPALDDNDVEIKRIAVNSLEEFNDRKINNIVKKKKTSIRNLLKDLHRAYKEQNVRYIAKHLDTNGIHLKLTGEGYLTFDGHLTKNESIHFFSGKFKADDAETEFFSVLNISDIIVTHIYSFSELIDVNEKNDIKYMGFLDDTLSDDGCDKVDTSLTLIVSWDSYRKTKTLYDGGAYLTFNKKDGEWYLVGFEQVYGFK